MRRAFGASPVLGEAAAILRRSGGGASGQLRSPNPTPRQPTIVPRRWRAAPEGGRGTGGTTTMLTTKLTTATTIPRRSGDARRVQLQRRWFGAASGPEGFGHAGSGGEGGRSKTATGLLVAIGALVGGATAFALHSSSSPFSSALSDDGSSSFLATTGSGGQEQEVARAMATAAPVESTWHHHHQRTRTESLRDQDKPGNNKLRAPLSMSQNDDDDESLSHEGEGGTRKDGDKETVVVLGAGVIGVTTAYYLARTGRYKVVVVERQPGPALETSFANGGHICVSDFMPMTDGGLVRRVLTQQLLRWRLKLQAAFRSHGNHSDYAHPPPYYIVRLRALLDPLIAWSLLLLVRASNDESAIQSGRGILELALLSQRCLHQIREEEELDYDRGSASGILHLYRSQDKFDAAKEEVQMLERMFDTTATTLKPHAVWSADQCRLYEPSLQHSKVPIAGGIWWEDNESGDCNMFSTQLAQVCRDKLGVTFLFNTEVSLLLRDSTKPHRVRSLLTADGREIEVDRIVICLGSFSSQLLLRSLNKWLPIFPVKGYSLTLPVLPSRMPSGGGGDDDDEGGGKDYRNSSVSTPSSPSDRSTSSFSPAEAAPSLNIADIESKTYIARMTGRLGDRVRVVGMGELCGYDDDSKEMKGEGLINLQMVVNQLFPRLDRTMDAIQGASYWACLRPMTPDSLPFIGQLEGMENVFINSGHGSMGWTLACGSSKLIASLISGSTTTEVDPHPYSPSRFAC